MNIYELLNSIIDSSKIGFDFSELANEFKDSLTSESDQRLYDLLQRVLTIYPSITKDGVTFSPAIVLDGKRTTDISDLTEDDYFTLSALQFECLPVKCVARISDILWEVKRDYPASRRAIDAYTKLFDLTFDDKDWLDAYNALLRAISISKSTKNDVAREVILNKANEKVMALDGDDPLYLSLKLTEILLENDYDNLTCFERIIGKIIASSSSFEKKEYAFGILKSHYHRKKMKEKEIKICRELADFYEQSADGEALDNSRGIFLSEDRYEKASNVYKELKDGKAVDRIQKKLNSVQAKKPKYMHVFQRQIDAAEIIGLIEKSFTDLTFEESVIKIGLTAEFQDKEKLTKEYFENKGKSVFSTLTSESLINSYGWTIAHMNRVDEISADREVEQRLFLEAKKSEAAWGSIVLDNELRLIRNKFDLESCSLSFLIEDNPIVPDGREDIFTSALMMALKGYYYESIIILAPQVEHLFRTLIQEMGGVVTKTKDGITESKSINELLKTSEFVEGYDENIIFTFRGLLAEHTGSYIRHLVAHGLYENKDAQNGDGIYFICAVIRLLTMYSKKWFKIYTETDGQGATVE